MIPILDKKAIKTITQNICPEQVEYVASINDIIKDVKEKYPNIDEKEQTDDVIFITKIMAFTDKFKTLHWAATNMDKHKLLDELGDEIEEYKDAVAENIQSIIGQFSGEEFTQITLPINNNPLDIINELKLCVNNWLELHKDDIEYEGCRSLTSDFIEVIHKYIYLFRLANCCK